MEGKNVLNILYSDYSMLNAEPPFVSSVGDTYKEEESPTAKKAPEDLCRVW